MSNGLALPGGSVWVPEQPPGGWLRRTLLFVLFTGWMGLAPWAVEVAGAELSASEILDRMAGTGVLSGSGQARLELVTENRRGQQRAYRLQIYRSEGPGDALRQLLEYLEPADVRGTKFLSIREPGGATQMWLYLPALGRERRIAGADVEQQFMGTDFTYEEIGAGRTYKTDYTAQRLADSTLDGQPVYVLKLTPRDAGSRYGFVQVWVWQETFVPLRIEFFDRRGQLEKQLTMSDLRRDERGAWLPYRITMANSRAGTRTMIRVLEYLPGEVPEEYFTLRYLRR